MRGYSADLQAASAELAPFLKHSAKIQERRAVKPEVHEERAFFPLPGQHVQSSYPNLALRGAALDRRALEYRSPTRHPALVLFSPPPKKKTKRKKPRQGRGKAEIEGLNEAMQILLEETSAFAQHAQ